MNSVDIKKMQQQQIAKMAEVRNLASQDANKDVGSAGLPVQINISFWLSEIALQLARHNELAEVSHGIRPVSTLQDKEMRSLWERIFGHKANDF
jgi:hypothetical protein